MTSKTKTTGTRELPILFSAAMVLALLARRKTQTRRVAPRELWGDEAAMLAWGRKRYGDPGDVLYIREAWRTGIDLDHLSPSAICERAPDAGYQRPWAPVQYAADRGAMHAHDLKDFGDQWGKLRPGIFLPKDFSRMRRRRTEPIHVEHIQDISADDIRAEGFTCPIMHSAWIHGQRVAGAPCTGECGFLRDGFMAGWDHLNGKRAPWSENPPLVVVAMAAEDVS